MKKVFFILLWGFAVINSCFSTPNFKITGLTGEDFYNFGNRYPKETMLRNSFNILNTGNDTLNILDIHPGCSCVSGSISKYSIAPGDTAVFNASFNTRGYKGYTQKVITIKTNDPNTPEFYLLLQVTMIYPLTFSPNEYFFFGDLAVNKPSSSAISIKNTTAKPIKILDIKIDNADVKITANPGDIINPNDSIELKATVTPSNDKPFFSTISFKTDCEEDPIFRVFVKGVFKK